MVEVSDETLQTDLGADLGVEARVYAAAGFPRYWIVSREGVYAHTDPSPAGYRLRTLQTPGETVSTGYTDAELPVGDLLAPAT